MTKRWLSLVVVLTLLASCFVGAAAEVTPKAAKPLFTFTPKTTSAVEYAASETVTNLEVGTFAIENATVADWKALNDYLNQDTADKFSADATVATVTGAYVSGDKLYLSFTAGTAGSTGAIKFADSLSLSGYDMTLLQKATVVNVSVKAATPARVEVWSTAAPAAKIDKQSFTGIVDPVLVQAKVWDAATAGSEISTAKVTWSSSNPAVATVAQKYDYDTLRAEVTPVSVGTAKIRATAENGKYTEIDVVVNELAYIAATTKIQMDGADITESTVAKVGQTYQMSVEISPKGATTGTVNGSTAVKMDKWSSANPAVATIDAATGVLTPVADGATEITVASADGKFSKTATVTVSGSVEAVDAVTFWVDGKEVSDGKVFTKPVTVELRSATSGATIKYDSGATEPTGATTPGTSVAFAENGAYVIKAQASKLGLTSSAESTLSFNVAIQPTALTLDHTTLSIEKDSTDNQTFTLVPTLTPANADVDVKVESSDVNVVKQEGSTGYTFKVIGEGVATITISTAAKSASAGASVDDGKGYVLSAKCVVTVGEVKPTGLTAPATLEVYKGETVRLEGVLAPEGVTNKLIAYTTSAPAKAQIVETAGSTDEYTDATTGDGVSDGVYVYGVDVGTATVTLVSKADPTLRRTVAVTVKDNEGVNKVKAPVFDPGSGKVFTTEPSGGNKVTLSSPTVGAKVYFTLDGSQPEPPKAGNATTYNPDAADYQAGTLEFTASSSDVKVLTNTSVTIRAIATKADMTNSDESVGTFTSEIAVTSVTLSPATATITGKYAEGESASHAELTATVEPAANAKNKKISWTSSNEAVAKVVPDSGDPLKADVKGVAPGTATITVTTEDGAKTATCKVTVTEVKVTGITASSNTAEVTVGETVDLSEKLTVAPVNASNATISWSSSNAAVASVDAKGVVTGVATNSTDDATAVITAICANAPEATRTAQITVTVKKSAGIVNKPTFKVDGVAPAASPAPYDKAVTVTATTTTADAKLYYTTDGSSPNQNSAEMPAEGIKVSKTTKIRVAAIKAGLDTAYNTLDVTISIVPTKVTIPTQTMSIGQKVTVTPVFEPVDATYKKIEWSIPVADRAIADVDANGVVTAKKAGTVTLTATVTKDDNSTIPGTGLVIVNNEPVTRVTVTPQTATKKVGEALNLAATIEPSTVQGATITWTSSDNDIATVNASGAVTAKKAGTVTITASCGAVSGTCTLTVLPLDDSKVPTKMISYTPVKAFTAVENSSISTTLGTFAPGDGETWSQVTDYFKVEVDTFKVNGKVDKSIVANVDPLTGVVSVTIPNVGKDDFEFEYTWRLTWKTEKGTQPVGNVLVGTVRTVTGNKLTITAKPTVISATTPDIADQTLDQKGTVTMGTIANYADFKATGVALTATPNVTPAAKATVDGFTADINDKGEIILTVDGAKAGEYSVTVTVSAAGCTSVTTKAVKVTVKEAPKPTEKAITVTSASENWKSSKGTLYLSRADGTVKFEVPGYTVTSWKSSKPKYLSIDENGNAELKKTGTIKVTATLSDKSKLSLNCKVVKALASEVKVQVYQSKKWRDVDPAEGITVGIGSKKAVNVRVVNAAKSGSVYIDEIKIGDSSIATRKANVLKGKIKGVVEGTTKLIVDIRNCKVLEIPVIVSASKDVPDYEEEEQQEQITKIDKIEEIKEIEAE